MRGLDSPMPLAVVNTCISGRLQRWGGRKGCVCFCVGRIRTPTRRGSEFVLREQSVISVRKRDNENRSRD